MIAGLLICPHEHVSAEDPVSANREEIVSSVRMMGLRAQDYYHRLSIHGGGGGSFSYLILSTLTQRPSNANGSFVLSSPTTISVTLTGTGIEIGLDGFSPIEVEAVVYPDSMTVIVTN